MPTMYCTKIWNIAKCGLRDNTRTLCVLRSRFDSNTQTIKHLQINALLPEQQQNLRIYKRFAHGSKKHPTVLEEQDSDDDETDSDDESDEDTSSDEETDEVEIPHYLQTPDANFRKVTSPSRRLDAVAKSVFNISRKRVETLFYSSMIRVNGELQPKKSVPVNVEDEIDIIIGPGKQDDMDMLYVKRAFIQKIVDQGDKVKIKSVLHKKLLIENYPRPWYPV